MSSNMTLSRFQAFTMVRMINSDFMGYYTVFAWVDPEDGTNRCSEMSAYKHNTLGNNPKNQN
jgi:hypothetical protein